VTDAHLQSYAQSNRDIIECMEFSATLQRRTPLAAIEAHGERRGVDDELPSYGPLWAGCWVPVTKSLSEILRGVGVKLREKADRSECASDIGPLNPERAAVYVEFLRQYRLAIESGAPVAYRLQSVRHVLDNPELASVTCDVPMRAADDWAIEELNDVLGIGLAACESLFRAGMIDADAIRAATDEHLRSVHGIGAKRLALIRAAVGRD